MTAEELADLKTKLAEAQAAYHQLMLGKSVVTIVDQNAERGEFTPASKQNLFNYILSLKSQIATAEGTSLGLGPIGAIF